MLPHIFYENRVTLAHRENVAMACVKITPQARKHSIRSNLIFWTNKVAILTCNIVYFIFNKINTFTLLQQPKFCYFLIAEGLFFLYLFA